jgi:lipopolysaccharide transport system permease protein
VQKTQGFSLRLGEVWRFRELLGFLVWRDIKVRYQQTALGAAWAIIQPAAMAAVFTLLFSRVAKLPSEGVPYSVFVLSGLVVWTYFSSALSAGAMSLVTNANLVTKVYFPRLIAPLSALVGPLVDFLLALVVLGVLMAITGVAPDARAPLALPFVALAFLTVLGATLWLAAINVRYRDVRYVLPFLLQLWMYATPVVYPASVVPESLRWLFALNPLSSAVAGFRWAVLGAGDLNAGHIGLSAGVATIVAVGGLAYFRKVERAFADII